MASSGKHVLVVDDCQLTRDVVRSVIQTHFPHWRILEASNGNEALAVSDGQQIDIMTLGMNLPGMDGVTLGFELRRRFPTAEISLLTTSLQQAARELANEAQMALLPRPVTEERILGYLRSVA